jgi:PelA/Pel-15E family pectate lyase
MIAMDRRATLILLVACFCVAAKKAARSDGGPRQYLDQPDAWFGTDDAKTVAANILSYQSESGGWPKNVDTTAKIYQGDPARLKSTFDNNATMDELRFLAHVYDVTKDPKDRSAVEKGVDSILKAQYPTGGWPQSYPPEKGYHRYITFNDGAMVRVLELLRDTYSSNLFSFLDETRKAFARQAFDRGIACILKCQIKVDGKLTAWCAQHDEKDLSPRPGRAFELTSISGSESVDVVRLLMSLDNPSPDIVRSIQGAMAWFDAVKIPGIRVDEQDAPGSAKGKDRVVVPDPAAKPMWARFYGIGTNNPIFSDRDGIAKAQLSEIGYERRNGYRWLYYWPEPLIETEYPAWKAKWASKIAATRPTTQP